MEAKTTVWLAKPEAPQDAESLTMMRWAIEEDAAREGSLAGQCLALARSAGLTPEDAYAFLAYHALLRLEEQQQQHMYLSDIAPFVEAPRPSGVAARLAEHVVRLARNAVGRVLHLERASGEVTPAASERGH